MTTWHEHALLVEKIQDALDAAASIEHWATVDDLPEVAERAAWARQFLEAARDKLPTEET